MAAVRVGRHAGHIICRRDARDETGEKFEDNMPWDSINAANFTKYGDMKPFGRNCCRNMMSALRDPEFQYIMRHYSLQCLKEKRIVSLNYAQRERERRRRRYSSQSPQRSLQT
jgi:hypothetical protein